MLYSLPWYLDRIEASVQLRAALLLCGAWLSLNVAYNYVVCVVAPVGTRSTFPWHPRRLSEGMCLWFVAPSCEAGLTGSVLPRSYAGHIPGASDVLPVPVAKTARFPPLQNMRCVCLQGTTRTDAAPCPPAPLRPSHNHARACVCIGAYWGVWRDSWTTTVCSQAHASDTATMGTLSCFSPI